MALKKSSKFGATEGLVFENNMGEAGNVQQVQEDDITCTRTKYKPEIVFGSTQGKKGHKVSRINMAFTPENHEWLKKHSRELGISATELANEAIRIIRERKEL